MATILLNPYLIVSTRTNTYHISQKGLQTFEKNIYQKVLKRTGVTREKNNLNEKLKRYITSIPVADEIRNTFWPKKGSE